MTPATVEELLREIPVGDSADARERAVAAARAEIDSRRSAAPARHPRRRALALAFATVLVGAALLTPPGRAASGWVGQLVGIGDVGSRPTQKHREDQAAGPAIVVNNGFAPEGSRYEWVVYHCRIDLRREQGLPGVVDGYGVSFEWPRRPGDGGAGGSTCEQARGREHGRAPLFQSFGTQIVPSQFKGDPSPDLVVSGVTDRRVHGVRIVYVDGSGGRHRLRVDFERIGRKLRGKLIASPSLGGTFVAFIPGAWAARDELESRLDLRALEGTGKLKLGPLGRRDRRRAARAIRICESKHLKPTDFGKCMDAHPPESPVQYVALDKRGHVLGRMSEPMMLRLPPSQLPQLPPVTKRPVEPHAAGPPIVLASGRSPDGGRYEWFVSHFETKKGKVYGNCEDLWWPGERVPGHGFCGPGLPPSSAFGRRHPERVFAKPFGFLDDARPATRYLMLSGYARPSVARVRVVHGGHDAPVELFRVDAGLAERMAASGPFGYFVAFVPRAAGKHPIEVLAYDASGKLLSRYEHRNDPLMH